MNVRVEGTRDGRVAGLRGVDSDAALHHLAHSLSVGVAFGGRRGLVIDLGGCQPAPETAELLRAAGQAGLRRRQVVTAAANSREVPAAVWRVRRGIDRVDHSGTGVPSMVVRDLSAVLGVADAGASIARGLIVALVSRRRSS